MENNSEIIVKEHELKLKIQQIIMQDIDLLKSTPDLGYTSWLTAEHIVNDIICEKRNKKVHRKKNFVDFFLPKL